MHANEINDTAPDYCEDHDYHDETDEGCPECLAMDHADNDLQRGGVRKLKIRNYKPKSRTLKTAEYDPEKFGDAWTHVTYEECEHEGLRANHFSYKIGSKTDCFECDQEDRA